jgi:outer membrane protein assembly factor BamB
MRRAALLALCVAACGSLGVAQGPPADWPQLFGPARNNIGTAAIPAGAGLGVAWRKPLPSGSAGLVVANGHVFTLGSDGEQDVLFAFDAATGHAAWTLPLGPTHADATANGPNATPALAGDLLVTVSTACRLQAIHVRTRAVVWAHDLGALFASRFAKRGGCGMSPLLAGSRIVVVTGAEKGPRLAAFDAVTGTPAWTAADLPGGYNQVPGWMEREQLVLYHHVRTPGASGITAIDAGTGAVAWQFDGQQGESDATPVPVAPGHVLHETWGQVALYDIATRTRQWITREAAAQRNPAVTHNGHIYMFGGQSGEYLTCLDAANGQVKWTSRIYRGHLLLAGDTLVVLSEAAGQLRLVAADPSGYREQAKVPVLTPGARTGTPPSMGAGHVFVRNLEEIVAVRIGG